MTNDDPISAPLSSAPFRDLAVAIKALYKHKDWNTDSVISVFEELTGKVLSASLVFGVM